jgi:hypothetical protein
MGAFLFPLLYHAAIMPVIKSASKAAEKENFHDLRHGKTFAGTEKKSGKKKAEKQMIAIVLSTARKAQKKNPTKRG